jgi:hypothetical protein
MTELKSNDDCIGGFGFWRKKIRGETVYTLWLGFDRFILSFKLLPEGHL